MYLNLDYTIYSYSEKDFYYSSKRYIILKYEVSNYFNELDNSIISVMIENGDDDCYVSLYSEINDIYLEDLETKGGNLVNRTYKSFNYIHGDKYIFISNFKNYYRFL